MRGWWLGWASRWWPAPCWQVATNLTGVWVTADFLPAAATQALGQTMAMSGLVFFSVLHLKPADAMTFGALLQTARLFGGEVGSAAISTFVRKAEQVSSQLIGLHVQAGSTEVQERLAGYAAAVSARSPGSAGSRAAGLLAQTVRQQANVESFVDGFFLVAAITAGALLLLALLGPAPQGPASPVPLGRRAAGPARNA